MGTLYRTVEHYIITQVVPRLQFIHTCLWDNLINVLDCFNDSLAFFEADDWRLMLIAPNQFTCTHTDNQIVTLLLGSFQNIEMSDMEHSKYTRGISNHHFSHLSQHPFWLSFYQLCHHGSSTLFYIEFFPPSEFLGCSSSKSLITPVSFVLEIPSV